MNYAFKITTTGRQVLAACIDSNKALDLTRVAFGDGRVSEDAELADQHELVHYVADGSVGDRRHSGERLYLTTKYSNISHPDVPTTYLSEFLIYAKDPESGKAVDFIYATLGDYTQPVPKYEPDMPPVSFAFPLTIVLSSDASVTISAPAGLVTYDELIELQQLVTVVLPTSGWEADEDTNGDYGFHYDIAVDKATNRTFPDVVVLPGSQKAAWDSEMASFAQGIKGAVRMYVRNVPTEPISLNIMLLSNPPYVRGNGSGGDSVQAGIGLSMSNGRLNVNIGNGISVDSANNVQVNQQTVVTEEDMLDEDATEADLRNILLNGNDR